MDGCRVTMRTSDDRKMERREALKQLRVAQLDLRAMTQRYNRIIATPCLIKHSTATTAAWREAKMSVANDIVDASVVVEALQVWADGTNPKD